MSSFEVRRFLQGLKDAGVVITNESDLVDRVTASKDPERTLCQHFTQGRSLKVTFAVDPNRDAKALIEVFKDNGLTDGFSYREFISHAKVIGE